MGFHADEIRHLFPSLGIPSAEGKPRVFLDNPAGTQAPVAVIEAVREYYLGFNANSGGCFATSRRNDAMVIETREAVADFVNAGSANEIVIGPNMTTLSFALSRAIGQTLRPGDEIVLTRMDHEANVSPWLSVAAAKGLSVKWVDIDTSDCTLDMDSLEEALSEKTRVLATAHASNAVGSVNPVGQIAAMARAVGALHVVDAVQSAPHVPIDVEEIGCDILFCSAYKFYGPHLGVMWGREDLLNGLPVEKIRPAKDRAPHRWENGTPSYETWNGLLACMRHWEMLGECYGDAELPQHQGRRLRMKRGVMAVGDYERGLAAELIAGLRSIGGVEVAGITEPSRYGWRVPTVAFVKDGHGPGEIAAYLAEREIYVWSGDYYAMEIMRRLGRPGGMVRVGIGQYNRLEEIDLLLECVEDL